MKTEINLSIIDKDLDILFLAVNMGMPKTHYQKILNLIHSDLGDEAYSTYLRFAKAIQLIEKEENNE